MCGLWRRNKCACVLRLRPPALLLFLGFMRSGSQPACLRLILLPLPFLSFSFWGFMRDSRGGLYACCLSELSSPSDPQRKIARPSDGVSRLPPVHDSSEEREPEQAEPLINQFITHHHTQRTGATCSLQPRIVPAYAVLSQLGNTVLLLLLLGSEASVHNNSASASR